MACALPKGLTILYLDVFLCPRDASQPHPDQVGKPSSPTAHQQGLESRAPPRTIEDVSLHDADQQGVFSGYV